MNVAIIGAGFTGLAAGYRLAQQHHDVTIFEKDAQPGGLAIGYREKVWDWTLEKHYHHWFTNDRFVLNLAKEIGHNVVIKRPKTSVYNNRHIYQLDSPQAFLSLPALPFGDRVRMLIALGLLRLDPFWQPLEKIRAVDFLPKVMGKNAWDMIWDPQLTNKMGKYADDISLAWFWTRITKRTSSLAYPEGGFLSFAEHLVNAIEQLHATVRLQTETIRIYKDKQLSIDFKDSSGKKQTALFDKVIVTLPMHLFFALAPELPSAYRQRFGKLQGLSATNLVLRLSRQFLTDGTYWLSICEKDSPVMGIFEHTNFVDKKYYNNEHVVYIGNYARTADKLDWNKEKILSYYDPFLKQINPQYRKSLIDYEFFTAPFAQPIVPINYSKMIPPFETPISDVFVANMQQVYPWDRGTNYAVELGEKIATIVTRRQEL